MDHVRELLLGQGRGEIDERTRHRRDRDAVVDRDVARVEVAGRVDAKPGLPAMMSLDEDVDLSNRAAPRLPQPCGAESGKRRAVSGGQHSRHVRAFLGQAPAADRVHAAVNFVERAVAEPFRDPAARQTELRGGQDSVLPSGDLGQLRIEGSGPKWGCFTFRFSWQRSVPHPPILGQPPAQITLSMCFFCSFRRSKERRTARRSKESRTRTPRRPLKR
jgi:hypothetical protein